MIKEAMKILFSKKFWRSFLKYYSGKAKAIAQRMEAQRIKQSHYDKNKRDN